MNTRGHKGKKTHNNTKEPYFDKSSAMISTLVNKTRFRQSPHCQEIIYINGSEFRLHLKPYVTHMALIISQPVSRTPQQMQYWSESMK